MQGAELVGPDIRYPGVKIRVLQAFTGRGDHLENVIDIGTIPGTGSFSEHVCTQPFLSRSEPGCLWRPALYGDIAEILRPYARATPSTITSFSLVHNASLVRIWVCNHSNGCRKSTRSPPTPGDGFARINRVPAGAIEALPAHGFLPLVGYTL